MDEQDRPVPETEHKEEEEDQLNWNVTNVEKFENYAEFDEAAHLESKLAHRVKSQDILWGFGIRIRFDTNIFGGSNFCSSEK